MSGPIRVLVVDDSAFMRRLISSTLASEPDIEVIGQARDGGEALDMVVELRPSVITLDVEMPGTNGYQALESIMRVRPTPVVMLSSLTNEGAEATIRCLELGAVDFVAKPSGSISLDLAKVGADLLARVRSAAGTRVRMTSVPVPSVTKRPVRPVGIKPACVFIGTSTGGPRALQQVVPKLPADIGVPIIIVQHMPAGFTQALANRLNDESKIRVVQASAGDRLDPNTAYVAPGGFHTSVTRAGVIRLYDAPAVHGVRPSADVTLGSLLSYYGPSVMGVLLTGMGRDGAAAMKQLRAAGGTTLVESEETCVVYGMPRAAVELGGAETILPLPEIAAEITRSARVARMAS